jgi:hypothetical protein
VPNKYEKLANELMQAYSPVAMPQMPNYNQQPYPPGQIYPLPVVGKIEPKKIEPKRVVKEEYKIKARFAFYCGDNITFIAVKHEDKIVSTSIHIIPNVEYNIADYFSYQVPQRMITLGKNSIPIDLNIFYGNNLWTLIGEEDRASQYYFYGALLYELDLDWMISAPIRPVSLSQLYDISNSGKYLRLEVSPFAYDIPPRSFNFIMVFFIGSPEFQDAFIAVDYDTPILIQFFKQTNIIGIYIALIGCLFALAYILSARHKSRFYLKKAQRDIAHHYGRLSRKKEISQNKNKNQERLAS